MGRLIRFLLLILLIAGLAGVAFVAVTDIPPPTREIVQKVPNEILFPDR